MNTVARALPAAALLATMAALAGAAPADDGVTLRRVDGRVAFGDRPTERVWSIGAVNSDKIMKLLLRSERFEDERRTLEESAKGKDEEFRRRFQELEA